MRAFIIVIIIAYSMLQGGCSTGGSMRVEVEVYKGPLSKEPVLQWAELEGLLENAVVVFVNMDEQLGIVSCQHLASEFDELVNRHERSSKEAPSRLVLSCMYDSRKKLEKKRRLAAMLHGKQEGNTLEREYEEYTKESGSHSARSTSSSADPREVTKNTPTSSHPAIDCDKVLTQSAQRLMDPEAIIMCSSVNRAYLSADYGFDKAMKILVKFRECDARMRSHGLNPTVSSGAVSASLQKCYTQVAQRAASLASHLQADAFLETRIYVGYPSNERAIRGLQVTYASYLSEIANQLSSRSDVLLKQMRGDDRRILPLSIYLRDAEPTEFLDLYVWNHAGGDDFWYEHGWTTERATRDRVRTVKRLFGDHNWKRINTVYGSGKGEMGTVLVKDDIGNWTLKAFDSDPTELLEAYKEAGKAAIVAAAKVAKDASGVGKAKALLGFANEVALGHGPASEAMQEQRTVAAMRQSTILRLDGLKADYQREKQELAEKMPALEADIKTQKTSLQEALTRAQENGKHTEDTPIDARLAAERLRGMAESDPAQAQTLMDQTKEKEALAKRLEQEVVPVREKLAEIEAELETLKSREAGVNDKYTAAARALLDDLQHNIDLIESMTARSTSSPGSPP